ncbi:MAG TPA: DUF4446 family protein [Mycobacteriales bacterium]|nr:DUF4446 family protein [Mycobacteriales bacterium]
MLDRSTLEVVALVAAGAAVLALGLSLALLARLARLRGAYDRLVGDDPSASFSEAVTTQSRSLEALRAELDRVRSDLGAARSDLTAALRHVAVVRYDAFADMGGRMSFSAALLDDAGDGLVLTSINGRQETRTYAKGIKAGGSEHSLSPEEEQAIERATSPREREAAGRRRRR